MDWGIERKLLDIFGHIEVRCCFTEVGLDCLRRRCQQALKCRRLIRMLEKDQRQSVLGEILELIDDIYKETASFSSETAEAIREAHTLFRTST